MPKLPPRPCAHPGCVNLVRGRGKRYCATHQSEEWNRRDKDRPSAAERGYDAEWRRIRREYLRYYPRCIVCGRRATVVHHVKRLRDGGTHEWSNLRAMCARCHNAETMRNDVPRGRV